MPSDTRSIKEIGLDSASILNFLRNNEAALNAVREFRVGTARATTAPVGWAASRGQLLEKACLLIHGKERSLAHELRWSKLIVKVHNF